MNALQAGVKLAKLNKEIEALDVAYNDLWRDFDRRIEANRIDDVKVRLIAERNELQAKLEAVDI